MTISIPRMSNGVRAVKQLAQGHTASEHRSWAASPGNLALEILAASGNFQNASCDRFFFAMETEEEVSFVLGILWGQGKEAEETVRAWEPKSPSLPTLSGQKRESEAVSQNSQEGSVIRLMISDHDNDGDNDTRSGLMLQAKPFILISSNAYHPAMM